MVLLDHFHPPLAHTRSWESFFSRWANSIGDQLHRILPHQYVAEVQLRLGAVVEAGNVEPAMLTLPACFPDVFEVQVIDQREGARLVAVVELVSPGNKDRPEARRAFAAKCGAYLQRGIGLVVADIVTSRQANLHDELAHLMGLGAEHLMPGNGPLYAAAYRPARRQGQNLIDVWAQPLAVGSALPTLPLALKGAGPIPLDLEASYTDARQRSRL